MDIAKEAWESQPSPHRTTLDHVEQVRDHMAQVWPIIREHLQQAQQAQARVYKGSPSCEPSILGSWSWSWSLRQSASSWPGGQPPYEVVERVDEVNYRVRQPGRRKPTQIYHINILKQWRGGREPPDPAALALAARQEIPEVPVGEDLSPAQKQDLDDLVMQHRDVFFRAPGEDHDHPS